MTSPDSSDPGPGLSPPLRQLTVQGAALILVLSLAWPYFGMSATALPWRETAFAIGGVALVLASVSRQPWWWRVMHGVFAPLAWWVSAWEIDPGWFLLAFILMLLVFRGAVTGQVPLYLTNGETTAALADILAERQASQPARRFLDLGAGVGSTLSPLADHFQDIRFVGIENAPLTWLVGRLRSLGQGNLEWRWGDMWALSLADFDVVYAFLSPAPMARLWEKARAEMAPGSLFISNSFPVPDVTPDWVVEVPGTPERQLHGYVL